MSPHAQPPAPASRDPWRQAPVIARALLACGFGLAAVSLGLLGVLLLLTPFGALAPPGVALAGAVLCGWLAWIVLGERP
ncbi:hypothetical protein [Falsiroseomonas selenitidurans]|uniref:Uncharacterized protein n=1 Tax=Falsiroseomonas selenitidurans TaxID=2716335 RepID=A0ABX1DZ54_9PROT|nr:hypothetical protein [Falsiroseomonas selenitidurans]NKC30185.1 hypothetical protein [Falsiroseomonas selenitidurans]